MADNEDKAERDKRIKGDEERIKGIVDTFNDELVARLEGRPYLMVVVTLHEMERKGDTSSLGASWNWRSNVDARQEGRGEKEIGISRDLMKFLAGQLPAVVEHPEWGLKKKYGFK